MKKYKVTAKCGHVGGIGKFIPIDFYTTAANGRETAAKIRMAGRVQHDKKDAIVSVSEIGFEEFTRGIAAFNADPYNRCHNPQEQRLYWDEIAPRVQDEPAAALWKGKSRGSNPKKSLRYGYGGTDAEYRRYCRELCA